MSQERIKAIRQRLGAYERHRNDPYAYFPEEITAVRELHANAAEDIAFLLSELQKYPAKQPIRQEEHFGHKVWVNPTTEALRESECLCLNCGIMKECRIAKKFLKLCIKEHLAITITRCFHWKPKN